MPYPLHGLLAFGGELGGGEIWSNSLRMGPWGIPGTPVVGGTDWNNAVNDATPSQMEEILDGFTPIIRDSYVASSDLAFWSGVSLTWAKFNMIGTDGRYLDKFNVHERHWSPGSYGEGQGSGSLKGPLQCTIAASFLTTRARGAASRGRIFMPPTDHQELATGATTIDIEVAQNLAVAVAGFLGDLRGWTIANFGLMMPGVVSNKSQSDAAMIERVRVGTVIDTQRRRRDALTEDYFTTTSI